MTGSELLVQRFVDQELSAEERVQLLVRLGRDEDLRQRVIALERLSLEASQLPRPVVPEGFVAQVLAQTTAPAPAPAWWNRFAASLWTPHVFEWNLAGAAAAACLALLTVGGVVVGVRSSSTAPDAPPTPVTASVAPPTERVTRAARRRAPRCAHGAGGR